MTLRNLSDDMPNITLNFEGAKKLDARITFERASTGTGLHGVTLKEFNVNVPRLTDKGLLIEEDKTNAITYSTAPDAEFIQTSSGISYTFDQPAPDGTNTAYRIDNATNTSAGAQGYFKNYAAIPDSGKITMSAFVKPVGAQEIWMGGDPGNQGFYSPAIVYYDFTVSPPVPKKTPANGTPSAYGLAIEPYIEDVGDGWYRLIGVVDLDSTSQFKNKQTRGPTIISKTPGTSVYVWGYQIEIGDYASSYIPTSGAEVTRAADIFAIKGDNFNSWYNKSESTMVVNMSCHRSTNLFLMWGFYGAGKRIEGYPGKGTPLNGLCYFFGNDSTQHYIGRSGSGSFWNQDGLLQKCAYAWNFQTGEGAVKLQDERFAPDDPPETGIPLTEPIGGFRLMGGQNSTKITNTGIVASVYYYPHAVPLEALGGLTQ